MVRMVEPFFCGAPAERLLEAGCGRSSLLMAEEDSLLAHLAAKTLMSERAVTVMMMAALRRYGSEVRLLLDSRHVD